MMMKFIYSVLFYSFYFPLWIGYKLYVTVALHRKYLNVLSAIFIPLQRNTPKSSKK